MVKDSPEKVDNLKAKPFYLQKVKSLIDDYLKERKWKKKSTLQDMLACYFFFSYDLGVTLNELKSLIEPLRPKKRRKPVTMKEIRRKRYLSVQPDDLPAETVRTFKELGFWEVLSQAVRINLVHDINSDSFSRSTGGAEGHVTIPGVITIDTIDEVAGEMISGEKLDVILGHEAAHVDWYFEHYDKPDLLRTTPNERNAYLLESRLERALFARKLEQEGQDPKDLVNLAYLILYSSKMVKNANKILGYPDDDFNVETEIVFSGEKPDLDIYPAYITSGNPVGMGEVEPLFKSFGIYEENLREIDLEEVKNLLRLKINSGR